MSHGCSLMDQVHEDWRWQSRQPRETPHACAAAQPQAEAQPTEAASTVTNSRYARRTRSKQIMILSADTITTSYVASNGQKECAQHVFVTVQL